MKFTLFGQKISIRAPFIFLLVAAVILFIYQPSISGEIIKLDDVYLFKVLANMKPWNVLKTFLPRSPDGIYYRPITMSTYYLDKYLLGLDPALMKIENIILHIINAFLVYWLAYQVVPGNEKRRKFLVATISALFFGLHPINTESVNWISGRTDILACAFILLSANFLVRFNHTHKYQLLGLSSMFLAVGFLSKETALGFLPGAIIMLYSSKTGPEPGLSSTVPVEPDRAHNHAVLFPLLAVLGAALLFLVLRLAAFTSNTTRFGLTLSIIASDIPVSTFVVMNALVFYLKKLFIPVPLNFAIIEPDPLYDFFGLPIVLLCLYLLIKKRTLVNSVFLAGVVLISPAFLVAFKQIAWTAYAERYVYMSSAFIVVASVVWADGLLDKSSRPVVFKTAAVVLITVLAASATYQRNIVWKYNLTLFKDTIEKSPNYSIVRTLYGFSLIERGDFKNARVQFEQAKKHEDKRMTFSHASPDIYALLGYAPDADLGIAYLLERERKLKEAAAAYEKLLEITTEKADLALRRLMPVLMQLIRESKSHPEFDRYRDKLLKYAADQYKYKEADTLYLAAKILLVRNDRLGARLLFEKAYERTDDNDEFKTSINKVIRRLDGGQTGLIRKTSTPRAMD